MRSFTTITVLSLLFISSASRGAEPEALLNDLKAKDPKTRLKAAEALASGEGNKVIAGLCEAVLDVNAKVSTAALLSLDKVSPDLSKHMTTFYVDRIPQNRLKAIEEIGNMGDKGKPALRALMTILNTNATATALDLNSKLFVQQSASAIKSIGINNDDVAKSLIILTSHESGRSIRLVAISALAAL